MSHLFSPLQLRELVLKNRIFVSPMCQYSSTEGMPTDWHLVHLGSRAVGGAALVLMEATAISPEGRISPGDLGIWSDQHQLSYQKITSFIRQQDCIPAIQLAHAGRKASTDLPWQGGGPLSAAQGGWQPLAPSALPFAANHPTPREMTLADIQQVITQFQLAAQRALAAGFAVAEIHMAHGYLLHEFLSPITNRRSDDYGGSLENRMRLPLAVTQAVRQVWPANLPVFVRISATDWVAGGWDLPQSQVLAREMKQLGIDLVDCSSGGLVSDARVPVAQGYQVPFAAALRKETGIATGAVGLISNAGHAEEIIASGQADAVLLARELLRNPYWPLHAARILGDDIPWPKPYARAKPHS